MLKAHHNMAERKNFLLLAIGMGGVCTVIGVYTMWNMVLDVLGP
jgi:hypothetical protein